MEQMSEAASVEEGKKCRLGELPQRADERRTIGESCKTVNKFICLRNCRTSSTSQLVRAVI